MSQNQAALQQSLDYYVDYANQSAEEISLIMRTMIDHYHAVDPPPGGGVGYFRCTVQEEEYYFKKAIEESRVVGSLAVGLTNAMNDLKASSGRIVSLCRKLHTYYELEEFKKDKYAGAAKIILDAPDLLTQYATLQSKLYKLTEDAEASAFHSASHPYTRFDGLIRELLRIERGFLNTWKLNLKEEIHTGWNTDELIRSISETELHIKKMKEAKPAFSYPASSMWPSIIEGAESILEIKRRALDGYNYNARQSDKHSNDVYLSLINHFNGVLVSHYNAFLGYASQDKFYSLKAMNFVPIFEVRTGPVLVKPKLTPFENKEIPPLAVTRVTSPISKSQLTALVNYISYINESWRQVQHFSTLIRNLNGDAAYYATLTDYTKRAKISFRYEGFELPQSLYQIADNESAALGKNASVLNEKLKQIHSILIELDQRGVILQSETDNREYEKDRCRNLYNHFERIKALLELWDEKKERLYEDVRALFDSYAIAQPTSSWQVSGQALHSLVMLDREALFEAKAHYTGKPKQKISTDAIDEKVRDVISKEFDNMKGIERLGRYNGLCPYTPYEDLPKSSRQLSELIQQLKPATGSESRYQHPYYNMLYQYNDVIRYYNKFAELSKVFLLPNVLQPELFIIREPVQKPAPVPTANQVKTAEVTSAKTTEVSNTPVPPASPTPPTSVVRDTVYIEKRDTVYIRDNGENMRSMEGFALNNMVLLIDISGSMNSPEKLPLLKKSILDLLTFMRAEDEISIVIFSGKPKVVLESVSFKEEERIKKAINSLKSFGTTDGNAALKLAYKVADENYKRGGNNRIILATDGEFDISDDTRESIRKFSSNDIFLTVFNFGKAQSTHEKLRTIAHLGNGNFEAINKENIELKLIREAQSKRRK